MEENFGATQTLKSSAEEIFNGNLEGVVWKDENGNPINDVGEYFKTKAENNRQEALKKYSPIGSVVKLKGRIGLYIIIGLKYNQDGIVFDYLAAKYPEGITNSWQIYGFNHNEITQFHHIGMQDSLQKAYTKKLLEEDINY